jgi:hypothetical protein
MPLLLFVANYVYHPPAASAKAIQVCAVLDRRLKVSATASSAAEAFVASRCRPLIGGWAALVYPLAQSNHAPPNRPADPKWRWHSACLAELPKRSFRQLQELCRLLSVDQQALLVRRLLAGERGGLGRPIAGLNWIIGSSG